MEHSNLQHNEYFNTDTIHNVPAFVPSNDWNS